MEVGGDGGEVAMEEVAVEGGVAMEAVGGEVEVAIVEDGVKEVAV